MDALTAINHVFLGVTLFVLGWARGRRLRRSALLGALGAVALVGALAWPAAAQALWRAGAQSDLTWLLRFALIGLGTAFPLMILWSYSVDTGDGH